MQVNALSSILFCLTALCAGTLTHSEPGALSSPGPSTTLPSRPDASPATFRKLLRRSVALMLQNTDGIRKEEEVQQLDMVAWSKDTMNICLDHINSTTKVTNPAGVAICYNLPVLIEESGVFTADFRLLRVSDPVGEWEDTGNDYDMSIVYDGAAFKGRQLSDREKEATTEGSAGATVEMLSDHQFIGQITTELLADSPSDEELKVILTPNITVIAKTKSGKEITTPVSVNGTKFLTGVFSNTKDLAKAEAEAVANAPFELPGTKIEIVPAGLYFFSAYLVVALGIVGWGTMDRAKFRDQYRKRMAQQGPR
ncbi:hypothetical protein EDC01DRAFT_310496 [Geopyxis carbonaria]|nr:hypothetical protein EDC01DRAFT_310496 [Geopyxis carbonaria]